MSPLDAPLAEKIKKTLLDYNDNIRSMPGIKDVKCLECLVEQMVESVRRIKYVSFIRDGNRPIHADRLSPHSEIFDPLIAAVHHKRQGNIDEASWLIFLSTHFGKHLTTEWGLTKGLYGRLGGTPLWTWQRALSDPDSMLAWLDENKDDLSAFGIFGNHRKYESLNSNGTGATLKSYIEWIGEEGHAAFFKNAQQQHADPKELFDYLYISMSAVKRFGRTGKFDYLTMLGKLRLINIIPGKSYVVNATGPLRGGRLLFGTSTHDKNIKAKELEQELVLLGHHFDYIDFPMQVLEDALCNWQKSPDKFISFRG